MKVFVGLVGALVLLASCGTFEYGMKSKLHTPRFAALVTGKSLVVAPVEVEFGGMRANLDLRGVVTQNGKDIFGPYLAKDTLPSLGSFAVLDTNIFALSKVDKAAISQRVTEQLLNGLQGKIDYTIDFFKGLGEGNYGTLSNRKLEVLSPKSPSGHRYVGDSAGSYFRSVQLAQAGVSGDLTLRSRLAITSEVVEILKAPEPQPSMTIDERARLPQVGEYWIRVNASLSFQVTDAAGAVVLTEKEPFEYPIKDFVSENFRMPVKHRDAEGFYKYLRTQDLAPYATKATDGFLVTLVPKISPFFVNTVTMTEVKAEKKKAPSR